MKIGVIGTGNMGSALMGPIGKRYPLCACNRGKEKLNAVCRETGAEPMETAAQVTAASDLVILAVKPNLVPQLLSEIAPSFTKEKILVSVAVGLPLSLYEAALGEDRKLIRAMPNTPCRVAEGVVALCYGKNCTEEDRKTVSEVFSAAGLCEELPESLMDGVSALTGSSPAYVYLFLEAMADAGVAAGIPRAQSYRLAAQAVLGSAKMVLETGLHPGVLKDQVCSPGGTTIRAVASLEKNGFRSAVMEAVSVCTEAAKQKK